METHKDRIWFTRKARIRASERLLRNETHAQILLVVYSLFAVVVSVVLLKHPTIIGAEQNANLFLTIVSLAILVLSLLIANQDFKGRGLAFKNNYLKLQRLESEFDTTENTDAIHDRYHELLQESENHASIDDKYFRVLEADSKISRPPSRSDKAQVYAYVALRTVVLTTLYLLPALLLILFSAGVTNAC